jgi:hypothetical protein
MFKKSLKPISRRSKYSSGNDDFLKSWRSQFQIGLVFWLVVNTITLTIGTWHYFKHTQQLELSSLEGAVSNFFPSDFSIFVLEFVILCALMISFCGFISLIIAFIPEILARFVNLKIAARTAIALIANLCFFILFSFTNPNQLAIYTQSQTLQNFSQNLNYNLFPHFLKASPKLIFVTQAALNENLSSKTNSFTAFLNLNAANEAQLNFTQCTLTTYATHNSTFKNQLQKIFVNKYFPVELSDSLQKEIQSQNVKLALKNFSLFQLSISPLIQFEVHKLFVDFGSWEPHGTNYFYSLSELLKQIPKNCFDSVLQNQSQFNPTLIIPLMHSQVFWEPFLNTIKSSLPKATIYNWQTNFAFQTIPIAGTVAQVSTNESKKMPLDFGEVIFQKNSFQQDIIELVPASFYNCFAGKFQNELRFSHLYCRKNSENTEELNSESKQSLVKVTLGDGEQGASAASSNFSKLNSASSLILTKELAAQEENDLEKSSKPRKKEDSELSLVSFWTEHLAQKLSVKKLDHEYVAEPLGSISDLNSMKYAANSLAILKLLNQSD